MPTATPDRHRKAGGKTTKTRTGVASGTALTFEQTASAAGFQKILNGNHTITVEVSDGKETIKHVRDLYQGRPRRKRDAG